MSGQVVKIPGELQSFEIGPEFPVYGSVSALTSGAGFFGGGYDNDGFYIGFDAYTAHRAVIHVPPKRELPRPHTRANTSEVRK